MIDDFWLLAGVVAPVSDEQVDSVRVRLESQAYQFLLAHGTMDVSYFKNLQPASRDALAAAGDRLRRENACLLAQALTEGVAAVLAPVDDGHALAEQVLLQGIRNARRERKGQALE